MTGHRIAALLPFVTSMAFKVASALAALLFSIAISRLMPLEDASQFFFMHSAATVLSVILIMGMDMLLLRGTAAFHQTGADADILDLRHSTLVSSTLASALLVPLAFAGLLLWGEAILGGARSAGFLFALSAPFLAYIVQTAEALRGLGRYNTQTLLYGIAVPTAAVVLLTAHRLQVDRTSVMAGAAAFLLSGVLVSGVAAALWSKARRQLDAPGRPARFRPELLRSTVSFFFLSGAQTIQQFVPVMIVGLHKAGPDLGLYYASFRIAMLVSFVLTASNVIIAPMLSRAHARSDHGAMKDLVRLSSAIGGLTATPIALVFFYRGNVFLGLFGEAYAEALPILRVLLIGQLVNAFSGAVQFFLLMSNKERTVVWINVLGLVSSIIGGYLLIGAYGSMGAAITATGVTSAVNLLAVAAVLLSGKFLVFPWVSRHLLSTLSHPQRRRPTQTGA